MLIIIRILLVFCSFEIFHASPLLDDNLCSHIAYSDKCKKLGSKYYLIDTISQVNWFDADRFCRRQNAFLVTIESANELKLISDFLLSEKQDSWFWMSGNDWGSEGIFYSISNGMLLPFTAWSRGEPNNSGRTEHCVALWKQPNGYKMNDDNCFKKMHFICELEDPKS